MTQIEQEKLVHRVTEKINELIEKGTITVASPEEFIKNESAKIRRTVPMINEFGIFSTIAKNIGLKIEESGSEDYDAGDIVETEVQIKNLLSKINDRDVGATSVKGKVIEAVIKTPQKKDKKTGEKLEETWTIAEIKLADPTGVTVYSQFYNDEFKDMFESIEDKSIVGKVLLLHNVKVEKPKYSGLDTQVSLKRGGGIEIIDEGMETGNTKPVPTPISEATDDAPHFFLLKVLKSDGGTTKEGKAFVKIFAKDAKGDTIDLSLWFTNASAANYPKDSTILAESKMKSREYGGKIFKSLNINTPGQIKVDPEGYTLQINSTPEVDKSLADVKIGDRITTIVLVSKIFRSERWKPYYLGCPVVVGAVKHRECGKSVIVKDDGSWTCGNSHALSDEEASHAHKSVNLGGLISDGTATLSFKVLDKGDTQAADGTVKASVIHKMTGKEVANFINDFEEEGQDRFYDWLVKTVENKYFKIIAAVKEDDYRGGIVLNLYDVEEVDETAEIQRIKSALKIAV